LSANSKDEPLLRPPTSTSLTLAPSFSAVSDMAAHDDDQDEGSIPLLETEPSSREPIFSKRQAQRTSPLRFTLATALLILGGLAAFYLWTTGRPAYTKYSRHWNAHSKQLYFRNGTAAKETELVRSLFGRAKDLGIDKFDLVASVYYRQYPENLYHGGHRSADESNSTLANASSTADATPTSTETAARALVSISAMVSSNGGITYLDYGGQDWKPPPEPEWQRIFSAPVIRELQVSQSGSAVVQVVLPGKIVYVPPHLRLLRVLYLTEILSDLFQCCPS
jgi:hypothetical protein